jgi:hypothetical protein
MPKKEQKPNIKSNNHSTIKSNFPQRTKEAYRDKKLKIINKQMKGIALKRTSLKYIKAAIILCKEREKSAKNHPI